MPLDAMAGGSFVWIFEFGSLGFVWDLVFGAWNFNGFCRRVFLSKLSTYLFK
jgi:hypothetical protein